MPQLGSFELGYGELGAAYPSSSTNPNTTDSLAIAFTESAGVTVPAGSSDSLALALSETPSLSVPATASDTLALPLSESTGLTTRLGSLSDSLAIALTRETAIAVISATDTLAVAISEAAFFRKSASETLSLALSEAPYFAKAAFDSLAVALLEAFSTSGRVGATILTSENLSLGLFEFPTVSVANQGGIRTFITGEPLSIGLREVPDVPGLAPIVVDPQTVAFVEFVFLNKSAGITTDLASDLTQLTLLESGRVVNTIVGTNSLSSTLAMRLSESSHVTQSSGLAFVAADSPSLALLESVAVQKTAGIWTIRASDSAPLALLEAVRVLNSLIAHTAANSTLSLRLLESGHVTKGSLPPQTWTATDTLSLRTLEEFSLAQSKNKTHRAFIVSDILQLAFQSELAAQSIPTVPSITQTGSEPLTLTLTESALVRSIANGTISFTALDSCSLALSETFGLIVRQPQTQLFTVAENLGIALAESVLVETPLVDRIITATDSLAIAFLDTASEFYTFLDFNIGVGDNAAIALSEIAIVAVPSTDVSSGGWGDPPWGSVPWAGPLNLELIESPPASFQFVEAALVTVNLGGNTFAFHTGESLAVTFRDQSERSFFQLVHETQAGSFLSVSLAESATATIYTGANFPFVAADPIAVNLLEGFILSTPYGERIGRPDLFQVALRESATVFIGNLNASIRNTQTVIERVQKIISRVRNTQTVVEIVMIPVPPKSYTDESVPPDIGAYCY